MESWTASKLPRGRLKVALAGLSTSVCAVFLTVPELAENGRQATKNTDPTAVANRPAGRRTRASATIFMGSSEAEQGVTPAEQKAITRVKVISFDFVFISIMFCHNRRP